MVNCAIIIRLLHFFIYIYIYITLPFSLSDICSPNSLSFSLSLSLTHTPTHTVYGRVTLQPPRALQGRTATPKIAMRFREASGKKKRKMAGAVSPITRQVTKENQDFGTASVDFRLEDVEDCLIYDRHGVPVPFKKLYQERKSVIIFVRVRERIQLCLA